MTKVYRSYGALTKAASGYLKDIGRSESTISMYNWIWGRIKKYMDINKIVHCSSTTVADYINATYGLRPIPSLTHHEKHSLRCALCLIQFAETGRMIEVIRRRECVVLSGEIGNEIAAYVESKRKLRLNVKTLHSYSYYLYQFLKYLNASEIHACNTISSLALMKYTSNLLPEAAGAKHLALSIIKGFLRYLYEQNKTARDFSVIVPKDNYKKQPKLPSTYTKDEVRTILNSIDRSTALGKRDYALLILAVRLGMRASDISRLKFENIRWTENSISFNQFKTNEKVVLPLTTDVGETLIDYIKYARPTSNDAHVFLEKQFPVIPISAKRVSLTASRNITKSGVFIGERKHGSHALRHTMASFLLEQKTPLPVISELLGHASTQTSMCYLRIDMESLRQCAMEVPVVSEAFYTQKGGAFYE
ncbi:site-specific integrase [Chitinophaga sp. LS1]|uniref:site-specific integrase n=1 Tax=Chitinophaga sp. LS1 TaxID=3051176 RepID=UPI002AABAAA0|nr:site-specific integrase [Chitinophaga sp. LS1]WPV67141.1 site-specific integrase [Chitinophaga sp. LS1]WPV69649.1 site-specific integrase [Chitinophaga sp. LS1]WPV70343.1 site-specific integrase [Chitinophaga sp. LS1]WPV70550.1 site-specific integrase [Chitinophaga sp. LS1]